MDRKKTVRLGVYSLVAGSILGGGSSAQGQIIFTDLDPDEVITGVGTSFQIDFNGDEVDDIGFNVFGSGPLYRIDASVGTMNSVAGGFAVSNLPYGAIVSSAGFSPSSNTASIMGVYIPAITSGGGFIGQTGYVGAQFDISGETHYGWVLVTGDAIMTKLTIDQFAYNVTPDEPIMTGELTSVENRSAKDATVYSYGRDINVRLAKNGTKGSVSVYDALGRSVHKGNLSKNNSRVNISGDKGIYLVKVESEGRTTTKKVYLN